MRKKVAVTLLVGLVAAAVAVGPAHAGKKKTKPVTFYLHGTETVGEIDTANDFAVRYKPMSTTKPAEPAPRSVSWITWTGEPAMWNDCAGSFLLPVWSGSVSGRIVGDLKVELHTFSAPTSVEIQIWPDLLSQQCATNDVSTGEYPVPAAQETVEIAGGPATTEVVLKDVDFKAASSITLQIRPHGPMPGRVLYDSPDYASSLTFTCIPASGRSCV